jgi:hypothetical protein
LNTIFNVQQGKYKKKKRREKDGRDLKEKIQTISLKRLHKTKPAQEVK